LIPTTVVGHAFWQEPEVTGRKNQQVQFLKNLGLIGGLLLVLTEKSK
jgi:putative oxidoreductase